MQGRARSGWNRVPVGIAVSAGPLLLLNVLAAGLASGDCGNDISGPIWIVGLAGLLVATVAAIVLYTRKQSSLATGILAGTGIGAMGSFTSCTVSLLNCLG